LLIIIFCVISQLSHAKNKIVLLTSLTPETNRPPLRSSKWNINEKLEERFFKEISKQNIEADLKIIHFADMGSLYETLKDPEVVALFWVSHAGFNENNPLNTSKVIIDHEGRDVKNVFQAVGPNLKFLGLIGCRGELFLDEWKENKWFSHNSSIHTFGRKVRTDARRGLKKALKSFKKKLENEEINLSHTKGVVSTNSEDLLEVKIERENHLDSPMAPVMILQRNRLITVLSNSSQDQVVKVNLNNQNNSPRDLKLIVDSGLPANHEQANLGRLNIETSHENIHWNLFETKEGKPIGKGSHIYHAKPTR